jgi:queuine tRNA-ribosyltransferase
MNELVTPHGTLVLPAFFPDATRGVARTVGSEDLERAGIEGLVVNVLHLSERPGTSAVGSLGGIHDFMGWRGVVACDSGGFQAYSLIARGAKLGSVSNRGFTYRLARGGEKRTITPAKCIERQLRVGADILFCLDQCTHPDDPADAQRQSVERTVRWARACRLEFDKRVDTSKPTSERPLLFAVVQGGRDETLRRQCAEELLGIGFDGFGYGGWPVTSDGALENSVALVRELLPRDMPLHALGIGSPANLIRAEALGYDIFDCVLPTRHARKGNLYVARDGFASFDEGFFSFLFIRDDEHRRDARPIEEGCDCATCSRHSRAYLRHLFEIGDPGSERLATIHNLHFYARLLAKLREARPR